MRRDHAAGRQQAFRRLHRLQPPAPRVMCTNICPRHSPPPSDHYPESPRVCAHAACTCNSTLSPPPRVRGLQLPSLRWPTMAPPPQRARGGARPREVRDGTGQGRCAASAHRPARRPPRPRRTAGCSAAGCSGCQGNAGGRGRAPFLSPPPVRWRRVRAGQDRGAYLVSWPSSSAPLLEYHEPACPARRLDDMFLCECVRGSAPFSHSATPLRFQLEARARGLAPAHGPSGGNVGAAGARGPRGRARLWRAVPGRRRRATAGGPPVCARASRRGVCAAAAPPASVRARPRHRERPREHARVLCGSAGALGGRNGRRHEQGRRERGSGGPQAALQPAQARRRRCRRGAAHAGPAAGPACGRAVVRVGARERADWRACLRLAGAYSR